MDDLVSNGERTIDGYRITPLSHEVNVIKEACDAGDTAITWLQAGRGGEVFGAMVTPDVVRAARLWWAETGRETRARGGLGAMGGAG